MTKIKNPLFSFLARGKLGDITFLRRRRTDIAEKTPSLKDFTTPSRSEWRHMYQKAVALWHALSSSEQQEWESLARPKHMTGFAWFISQALKPNPGLYLPLQGGTMQGDIDMFGYRVLVLPEPAVFHEPATKKYCDDAEARSTYTQGARAYHDIDQTIPNGQWTTISFNSERYDTDNIHDPVTNNSRLTCRTAGTYLIIAGLGFDTNSDGYRSLYIKLNGVTAISYKKINAVVLGRTFTDASSIYPLVVSDYVEFLVHQDSGTSLDVLALPEYSPEFMMQRIG